MQALAEQRRELLDGGQVGVPDLLDVLKVLVAVDRLDFVEPDRRVRRDEGVVPQRDHRDQAVGHRQRPDLRAPLVQRRHGVAQRQQQEPVAHEAAHHLKVPLHALPGQLVRGGAVHPGEVAVQLKRIAVRVVEHVR